MRLCALLFKDGENLQNSQLVQESISHDSPDVISFSLAFLIIYVRL